MTDLRKDIYLPENLNITFEPFCKGCRYGDFYLEDNERFWENGQIYYRLKCEHLQACNNTLTRYENESKRNNE